MALFNRWLPPPIAAQVPDEKRRFSALVTQLEKEWQPDDPFTRLATVQWVPVINSFLGAKSELEISDVEVLVWTALKLILCSTDNLYIQERWGQCLTRVLIKKRRLLALKISWRPLYELVLNVHFERRHSYEGYALKRNHLYTMVSLIRICRRFFPPGSVKEIWNEFRPALENVSHNSALEAMGFLSLLLPSPRLATEEASQFFTSDWVKECIRLWDALPHSNYWSLQWASLLGRCIKRPARIPLDWEPFLPTLFMHYLRSFEVPVGRSGSWPPFFRRIPREVQYAFYSRVSPMSEVVGRSIVYLLSPGGAGQRHLESLIDLLEQYYHPSNGGLWTSSLDRFLRSLVFYFMKRVAGEQLTGLKSEGTVEIAQCLGPAERVAFVKVVMRLIERGQYSKNVNLAESAAMAASRFSYVEPKIVLPHIVSCFQTAMGTITATHQLQSSLTSLALATRSLLLASTVESEVQLQSLEVDTGPSLEASLFDCRSILVEAMFSTLLGLDANDPPKTLATLQLYCSVLSSVQTVGTTAAVPNTAFPINWSMWVEMFLSRLFVLLLNLEPPSFETETENGFLMEPGSHYSSVLTLIFGKATPDLYNHALRMVTKFVRGNILPGAAEEIGILCSHVVHSSPSLALPQLAKPMMDSVVSSLGESPSTGFSTNTSKASSHDFKVGLSPALETTVGFQLKVLSTAVLTAGAALPPHKELLKEVIAAAFDAPSAKVNTAGNRLLRSVIRSMTHYYPLECCKSDTNREDGLDEWFSSKGKNSPKEFSGPAWHSPNPAETSFVEELLDLHLRNSLSDLKKITEEVTKPNAQERERLRVVLLRLEGCLQGVGSCLPDFDMPSSTLDTKGIHVDRCTIVGAAGIPIGSAALREEVADTLHLTCIYMLRDRADDTILLKSLVRVLHLIGNYGATDYSAYAQMRSVWLVGIKALTEPHANLITCPNSERSRRPRWLLVERTNQHQEYRASQARYHLYTRGAAPHHVTLVLKDLLKLSLHSYFAVRSSAGSKVERLLLRYPALIKDCIPLLTASLQDPQAKEETVLGACNVFMLKPVMRHLMEDWNALASFFLSLLSSSHHATIKAQNAINELFLVFNILYGGVPFSSYANSGASLNETSYSKIIAHIQEQVVPGGPVAVHWRYNLMANGILLFLVLPPPSDARSFYAGTVTKSRESMAGGFISNLQSELPALRPISVIALLFLLQATSAIGSCTTSIVTSPSSWLLQQSKEEEIAIGLPSKTTEEVAISLRSQDNQVVNISLESKIKEIDMSFQSEVNEVVDMSLQSKNKEIAISLKSAIVSIMQSQGFGHKIISNLAVDHHYFEGQNSYNPQRISDVGLTALMPTYMREWPFTRTWDPSLEGEAFSSTFARLFQYLVQECGSIAFETLRGPLEEACNEVEERGKQCIASEIMAGLLHSDNVSVIEAWDYFLCPLLRKALLNATMESATEWAACVRFAVGGEGRNGHCVPILRYKILNCLAQPLPDEASTSLLTKRLTLLRAALNELLPNSRLDEDIRFQICLLNEVVTYMSHRAPQVRQGVGKIMCVLCANLMQSTGANSLAVDEEDMSKVDGMIHTKKDLTTMIDWKTLLVNGAVSATLKIRSEGSQHLGDVSTSMDLYSAECKEAIRWMETALYFVMAAVKSGNGPVLMDVLVQLLHPLLSLQETWNKELAKKAKSAMRLMQWQPFGSVHLGAALTAVLTAATDTNWHTRVAAVKFIQPLTYRHTFIMASTDLETLWKRVRQLLSDPQLEVRELAATTLAGMMKGEGARHAENFRVTMVETALAQLRVKYKRKNMTGCSVAATHGLVLGLSACVLSVPYDMPGWLPETVVALARFIRDPWPIRATVTKTIGEFRRTHMDTWDIQKTAFNEDQLEILSDLTSSASYFA